MRTFSNNAKNSLIQLMTDEVWLALLHLKVDAQNFYVVWPTDSPVTSNGQDYAPYPFDLILPVESLEANESAQITIDNVDLSLVSALRSAVQPLQFNLKLVLASTPNVIEFELADLMSDTIQFDASKISATLAVNDVWNQKFPSRGGQYDPAQFPGLF